MLAFSFIIFEHDYIGLCENTHVNSNVAQCTLNQNPLQIICKFVKKEINFTSDETVYWKY